MDLPAAKDNLELFKEQLEDDYEIIPISTITRDGLRELLFKVADKLDEIPKNYKPIEEKEERVIYRYEKQEEAFHITRDPDGAYVLYGAKIEKLFKMTDFSRDESAQRFARQMRSMGVDDALRERGAEDGDTVRLLDYEFEFME